MRVDLLVFQAQQALLLVVAVSAPVLLAAAVVGTLVAAFQAATQVQDPTLSHLPRFLAVVAVLVAFGASMARPVADFAIRTMQLIAR